MEYAMNVYVCTRIAVNAFRAETPRIPGRNPTKPLGRPPCLALRARQLSYSTCVRCVLAHVMPKDHRLSERVLGSRRTDLKHIWISF